MKTKEEIKQIEDKLKKLKVKLEKEQDKNLWLKIPEENIEITSEQQFNGKKYPEILELVKEEEIASYTIIQRLRNTGKYKFLEDFWVLCRLCWAS